MRLLTLALLVAWPALARAADRFEVSGHLGPSFPFYDQTFGFAPGAFSTPSSVLTIEPVEPFRLQAQGGLALGGSLAWYFLHSLGLEARVDLASLNIEPTAGRFRVRVRLPPPLPEVSQDVVPDADAVQVDRPRPLSLNLKVRHGGRPGLYASAGVSYLPNLHLVARQRLAFGPGGLDPRQFGIDLGSLTFEAEALPVDQDESHWGFDGGAGLVFELTRGLSATVEGRYFRFQKRTLRWRAPLAGPPGLEEVLRPEIERQLQPVEFDPTYFQATAGLAWRF